MVFFQSREQMKACFGDKAATVLDNIGTQQYFNVQSYETADEISKRIGETTVATRTSSYSSSDSRSTGSSGPNGPQGNYSTSSTFNQGEVARRVMKPEEILTLSKDVTLIFHENMSVIPAKLIRYYRDKEFRWGRTGKQPGVGLAGGLIAATLLAASLAFADAADRIARLPPIRVALPSRPAMAASGIRQRGRRVQAAVPPGAGTGRAVAAFPPQPVRKRRHTRLTNPSGFLPPGR